MNAAEPAASALAILDGLVGDAVAGVRYLESRFEDNSPHFEELDYHSLDFGLELQLGSGRIVSFIWKWPVCYYLAVVDGDLNGEVQGDVSAWEATRHGRWLPLLGQKIIAAELGAFQIDEKSGDYPYTVRLRFCNDAVVYISLGIGDAGDDALAVLFSEDLAIKYGRSIG